MTDREIRAELRMFANRIFEMRSSEAPKIRKELDDFRAKNNVTFDQLQEFAQSGAGEMLHMLTD